jgi:hypothetical protein
VLINEIYIFFLKSISKFPCFSFAAESCADMENPGIDKTATIEIKDIIN